MKTQNLVLIPETTYSGTANITGQREKAASYYPTGTGLQSVLFDVDDFAGTIVIQATLDSDPTADTEWFDVYTFPDDSSAITAITSQAITGNFTWMRAKVTGFTGGVINYVKLVY